MINSEVHAQARRPTRTLAEFGSKLRFEDLPLEVVRKCKLCILDSLGCCIFGSTLPSVKKLTNVILREGGNEQASLLGTPYKASASQAALVNGTSAHAFQLDEVHADATLHPGSIVIPTVFALSESSTSVSGREAIAAIVAGYEVGVRIGLAADGNMFKRGYHNQGTTGVFAAASAAARILGLDSDKTVNALGIAGSQAAGLMAVQEGAMAKSFHSGRAAQSGVYAALLAAQGYTGIPEVLEVPYGGFFSTLAGQYRAARLVEDVGQRWKILEIGHSIWPAANASVTAMETLDRIMSIHGLDAGDISEITAYASTNAVHHCGWHFEFGTRSVLAAQMNLYYGLAIMALDRAATPDQFSETRIQQTDIGDFIKCIHIRVEPGFDEDDQLKHASRIEVRCRDGRSLADETLHRKGSRNYPLTEKEIKDKFLSLAGCAMTPTAAEDIVEKVSNLDALPVLDSFFLGR